MWPYHKVSAANPSYSSGLSQLYGGKRTICFLWFISVPPENFPRHCYLCQMGLRGSSRWLLRKGSFQLRGRWLRLPVHFRLQRFPRQSSSPVLAFNLPGVPPLPLLTEVHSMPTACTECLQKGKISKHWTVTHGTAGETAGWPCPSPHSRKTTACRAAR